MFTDAIANVWKLIRATFEYIFVRIRYNPQNIAMYYRKQGALVGENCYLYTIFYGIEPYLINIGNGVFVASEVILHTHNPGAWILKKGEPEIWGFGKIVIEDNCIIGARVQIMPNVRIGHDTIVGAGSVVINDVPPNSIVMGVPARVIGSSKKYKEKCLELWQNQMPPGWSSVKSNRKIRVMKEYLMKIFKDF